MAESTLVSDTSVGYSRTPLLQKLGIKSGFKIVVLNAPHDYRTKLGELPDNVTIERRLVGHLDFIHFFTRSRLQLESEFPKLKGMLSRSGMLWISWPKSSSGLETDLSENIVRRAGLDSGLVDVKIVAVDETWSGLKFVFRLKDREGISNALSAERRSRASPKSGRLRSRTGNPNPRSQR